MVKHGLYLSLLVIMPFLLIQVAYPEEVLSVSFTIHRNDTVELDQMRVINGKPTFYFDHGDYMVQVAGADGKMLYFDEDLRVDFLLYTNPPTEINYSLVSLRIPYDPGMRYFRVYKGMELIYEEEIDICNSDGLCDEGFETSLSCPADCPSDKADSFCVGVMDGTCDPDCYEGVDPDCGVDSSEMPNKENTTVPRGGEKEGHEGAQGGAGGGSLYCYVLLLIFAVLLYLARKRIKCIFFALFIYMKMRRTKMTGGRDPDFGMVKDSVERNKKS